MGKKEPDDVVLEECSDCGEKFDENLMAHSEHHGILCVKCARKQWPDHVIPIDGEYDHPKAKDVVVHGVGPSLIIAIHGPTGIAAAASTERKARKLLGKVYNDVETVERNERYGSIME